MKKNKLIKIINFTFIVLFCLMPVMTVNALRCTDLGELKTDIQNIFNFMKIIVPLLVIGLTIYDFIRSVTSKDDKDFKGAFKKMTKRLILAAVFFFLPVLINLLLDLFMIDSSVCVE